MVGGDSPVAHPRGCRPRGGYVAGYRAGVPSIIAAPSRASSGRETAMRLPGCGKVEGCSQRPPAGTIPDAPGSYQFRDRDGRVIYVGKAKSLRSRLSNYFQNPANLPPRTAQMVAQAETVEWIQVRNDVEAVMLEYSLIKQHKPRFNVRLRDDKSYPFLAVTVSDEWPRAMVRRGHQGQGQPLLRSLRPRLRHPGDARLAAAHLPDPDLQRQQVPHPPAAGQALPALPHREVLGPVRRRHRPRRPTRAWSASWWPSSTGTPSRSSRASRRRCARPPTPWSTNGPAGFGTG